MLKEMKDHSSEIVENVSIDFRTAKNINNDFVDILRALTELNMRTEEGKETKERFMEAIVYELEKLENSRIVL